MFLFSFFSSAVWSLGSMLHWPRVPVVLSESVFDCTTQLYMVICYMCITGGESQSFFIPHIFLVETWLLDHPQSNPSDVRWINFFLTFLQPHIDFLFKPRVFNLIWLDEMRAEHVYMQLLFKHIKYIQQVKHWKQSGCHWPASGERPLQQSKSSGLVQSKPSVRH